MPEASAAMDWEAKLAVVISAPVRHADETATAAAIAGYAVLHTRSQHLVFTLLRRLPVPKTLSPHATWEYSWIRPPSWVTHSPVG